MAIELLIAAIIAVAGALMMVLAALLMVMRSPQKFNPFDGGFEHDNAPRITLVRGKYIKEQKPGDEM